MLAYKQTVKTNLVNYASATPKKQLQENCNKRDRVINKLNDIL